MTTIDDSLAAAPAIGLPTHPSPRPPVLPPPSRRLARALRWILLSNLLLWGSVVVAGVAAHAWFSRDMERLEQAISWTTRYVLAPASFVEDRGAPAEMIRPLAQLIERVVIDLHDRGTERPLHRYWQGRLLLPMAATYGRLKMPAEQLDRGARAIAIFQRLVDAAPTSVEFRRRLAVAHDLHAQDLAAHGRPTDAIPHYRREIAIADTLLAEQPDHWRWRWYRSTALLGIGRARAVQGDVTAARPALSESLTLATRLAVEAPSEPRWPDLVAKIDQALSNLPRP